LNSDASALLPIAIEQSPEALASSHEASKASMIVQGAHACPYPSIIFIPLKMHRIIETLHRNFFIGLGL
jgi:hypothetical protein